MDTQYATVVLASVESTQDEVAARFVDEPVLVVAASQSRGRGRFDRGWVEPDRGLFTSLGFSPEWPPRDRGLIPLVAGLAMREALGDWAGVTVGLRWPNDLVIGPDKVGGILVEATDDRVIAGCGVNLWWADPPEGARGVLAHDPGRAAAPELGALWASSFLGRMAAEPTRWGHQEYRAACVTLGETVSYQRGRGTAVGIGADGSLLVDTDDRTIAVHSGEVRLGTTLPDASTEESN
jgi:BirA family biotin operon repressor/biotin-[acetyl-CoA-carboxylase] ligase